jgi:hypothetical protein
MPLRIRYERAIARGVASILRDIRGHSELEAWWSKLGDENQRLLSERWRKLMERCLEFPGDVDKAT